MLDIFTERVNLHKDYETVFKSPAGINVLNHLAKKFNISSPTYTQGDTHMTAFREGQRHVVLTILKFVNKDSNQLLQQTKDIIEDE
jgi:hypothetical protein